MDRVGAFRTLAALAGARVGVRPEPGLEGVDWNAVALMALEHHLLASLWLGEEAGAPGLPPELAEAVAMAGQATAAWNAGVRRQLLHLGRTLNAAGIEPLLLKGAASLIGRLYPHPWQREMGDIDVAVRPERIEEARGLLIAAGYAEPPGQAVDNDHELPALRHPEHPAPLELHFEVADRRGRRLLPTAWAWEHSRPAEVGGVALRLPQPVFALLHAFAHPQLQDLGHRVGDLRLRRLVEFALLRARHGEPALWRELEARCAAAGCGQAFAAYVALADALVLGREAGAPAALARTMRHVRWPALTQGATLMVEAAGVVRGGKLGPTLAKLVQPRWYAEKARRVGAGRRAF